VFFLLLLFFLLLAEKTVKWQVLKHSFGHRGLGERKGGCKIKMGGGPGDHGEGRRLTHSIPGCSAGWNSRLWFCLEKSFHGKDQTFLKKLYYHFSSPRTLGEKLLEGGRPAHGGLSISIIDN